MYTESHYSQIPWMHHIFIKLVKSADEPKDTPHIGKRKFNKHVHFYGRRIGAKIQQEVLCTLFVYLFVQVRAESSRKQN